MRRVLILGGTGMLGHSAWLACRDRFETWVTLRSRLADCGAAPAFVAQRVVDEVDAFRFDAVQRAFDAAVPDVVINAVGIVKQLIGNANAAAAAEINALLPHRLAALCTARGARLIHVSTDCVFSGRRGMYREDDEADADDLHGRSKRLGEVGAPSALTIRTSFVGPELATAHGLLEWFLRQSGRRVHGYRRVFFSGLTTPVLAGLLADLIERRPLPVGTYHVSGERIDKHRLLCLFRDAFGVDVEIEPVDTPALDRSLDSSRFRALTGFQAPAWPAMVAALAEIRSARAGPAM
jgi:dTDP-4-dehydrorhamnose reductase